MDTAGRLYIEGARVLSGTVPISGSKNAALPILAASLLSSEPVVIQNLPHLKDVSVFLRLLRELGASIRLVSDTSVTVDPSRIQDIEISYALVKAMRASILVLGPLLARFGEAKIALPGGCAIGLRPIDLHLSGLESMGAKITIEKGYVHAAVSGRLQGANISMPMVSVTATENLMMAACLASGETVIQNAACEPEVVDLGHFLQAMGAEISGLGTSTLRIQGRAELSGARWRVIPDRIEAGTYLVAAAASGGCVTLTHCAPEHMESVLAQLRLAGANIDVSEDTITADMRGRTLKAVNIVTAPYPGFPTDMQAQFIVLNVLAQGEGAITETIFENRFMHIAELQRMGARIKIQGNTVVSHGADQLVGVPVTASDLRASAALVIAGLVAQGETVIDGVHHLDRGYAYLEEKIGRLGGMIRRSNLPLPTEEFV